MAEEPAAAGGQVGALQVAGPPPGVLGQVEPLGLQGGPPTVGLQLGPALGRLVADDRDPVARGAETLGGRHRAVLGRT